MLSCCFRLIPHHPDTIRPVPRNGLLAGRKACLRHTSTTLESISAVSLEKVGSWTASVWSDKSGYDGDKWVLCEIRASIANPSDVGPRKCLAVAKAHRMERNAAIRRGLELCLAKASCRPRYSGTLGLWMR